MRIKWLLILALAIVVSSCSSKQRKEMGVGSLPLAIGNAYQGLIVMEESLMKSPINDTIGYYFTGPYLIVPTPQPVLDISAAVPRDFIGYAKHRRNIIFIGALDSETRTSNIIRKALGAENVKKAQEQKGFRYAIIKNKWARGQRVIYVFAPTTAELPNAIRRSSPKIIKEIYQSDQSIARASAYAGGSSNLINTSLKEKLNISMNIPKGFRLVNERAMDDSTVWMRYDAREVGYNIIVRVMDYHKENQISTDNLIKTRNKLGRRYVGTTKSGTYMSTVVKNKPFPVFQQTQLNNQFALEGRGLWRTVGDYMGGPFLSYMVLNPNTNRLVFMDGFIQAPGKKEQRDYVERLKTIMESLNF